MDIASLFHTGYDFESYLAKLKDDGLKFGSRYEKTVLPDPVIQFFQKLDAPLHILLLSEPWCPDCVLHVPLLARMAEIGALTQLMIFPRDQYPDLADTFAVDGKKIIPAAIFLNEQFTEIGRWYERPSAVQRALETATEQERDIVKKEYLQGKYLDQAAGEILHLLEEWRT